jgi:hypothetical protein
MSSCNFKHLKLVILSTGKGKSPEIGNGEITEEYLYIWKRGNHSRIEKEKSLKNIFTYGKGKSLKNIFTYGKVEITQEYL